MPLLGCPEHYLDCAPAQSKCYQRSVIPSAVSRGNMEIHAVRITDTSYIKLARVSVANTVQIGSLG